MCGRIFKMPDNAGYSKKTVLLLRYHHSQMFVTYLFSKEELLKLVDQKLGHPLSREPIRMDMIVRKRDCYFNTLRDTFASV
nr:type III secretion system effector protein [Salmonella sp. NCTC 7297]